MNNPCSRGCGYPYRRPAAVNYDQGNCSRQTASCAPQRPMPCAKPAPEPRCQTRTDSCVPQRPMPCAKPAPEPRCQARTDSCVPQRPMPCAKPAPEPRCQATPAPCASSEGCSCAMGWNPKDFPVAMGYVPMQKWSCPMNLCRALQCGTIFEDLNKPFCGKGGACR